MAAVPVDRRGFASSMRAFFNNTGMVISMTIALPLLIGMIPLEKMMDLFVVGSADISVAIQIQSTQAISFVFMVSAVLIVPAIIVSAMRGKEELENKKSMPDDSPQGE
jgi:hypothetical protein